MDFLHFWIPFVRTFQFLGISHYIILRPELKNHRIKLILHQTYFFAIILIQFVGIAIYLKIVLETRVKTLQEKYNMSPLFVGVNIATRFSQFLCVAVIPFETFFKRHIEQKLVETFQRIDEICRSQINRPIDYYALRRRQLVKTWLLYIVTSLVFFSSLFLKVPVYDAGMYVFYGAFLASLLRVFQFAFHINVLIGLLGELKLLMRHQQQRSRMDPAQWMEIKYARKMYSNLWLAKTLIGDCYGFSMILFIVDRMVKQISSAYWFYVNIESIKSNSMHMR